MTGEVDVTYSITGIREVDMGCVTEISIVKCFFTDRVLHRSCLDRMRQDLLFFVRILRFLHLMLRQLGLVVVIEEGIVDLWSSVWSCDGSVNKHIMSSISGVLFDPLTLNGPSGRTRLLLPSARTHLAPMPFPRGNSTRCVLSWQMTQG